MRETFACFVESKGRYDLGIRAPSSEHLQVSEILRSIPLYLFYICYTFPSLCIFKLFSCSLSHTCMYLDTRRYCRYAKTLNVIFNPIFFVQFFSSITVLCTSVYYLSRHITDSGSSTFVIYTISIFVQIYVYCWSGNEVILEVNNYVYILGLL